MNGIDEIVQGIKGKVKARQEKLLDDLTPILIGYIWNEKTQSVKHINEKATNLNLNYLSHPGVILDGSFPEGNYIKMFYIHTSGFVKGIGDYTKERINCSDYMNGLRELTQGIKEKFKARQEKLLDDLTPILIGHIWNEKTQKIEGRGKKLWHLRGIPPPGMNKLDWACEYAICFAKGVGDYLKEKVL